MMKRAWIHFLWLHMVCVGSLLVGSTDVVATGNPLEITYAFIQEKVGRCPQLEMNPEEVVSLCGEPIRRDEDGDFIIYSYGNEGDSSGGVYFFRGNKIVAMMIGCEGLLQRELGKKIGFPDQMIAVQGTGGGMWIPSSPAVKTVGYEFQGRHVIINESEGDTSFGILEDDLYNGENFPFRELFNSVDTSKKSSVHGMMYSMER